MAMSARKLRVWFLTGFIMERIGFGMRGKGRENGESGTDFGKVGKNLVGIWRMFINLPNLLRTE